MSSGQRFHSPNLKPILKAIKNPHKSYRPQMYELLERERESLREIERILGLGAMAWCRLERDWKWGLCFVGIFWTASDVGAVLVGGGGFDWNLWNFHCCSLCLTRNCEVECFFVSGTQDKEEREPRVFLIYICLTHDIISFKKAKINSQPSI